MEAIYRLSNKIKNTDRVMQLGAIKTLLIITKITFDSLFFYIIFAVLLSFLTLEYCDFCVQII